MSLWVLLLTLSVVIVDQVLKYVVRVNLKPIESVSVIDGLLNWTYVENRGAAFGFLSEKRWLLIAITVAVLFFIFYVVFSKKMSNKLFLLSMSLIAGGGIGNLIDRIFLGYVVDYIQVSFFPPVCNFADYCITFGAVMLFIYVLKEPSSLQMRDESGRKA